MEENKNSTKSVKTTASDIGVKLLDIISKPIGILCDYAEEPIRIFESMRKINEEDNGRRELNNEIRREKEFAKIHQKNIKAEQEYQKANQKMKEEMARAESEIEEFRNDSKMKNYQKLMTAMANYQIELTDSYKTMQRDMMKLSIETAKELSDIQLSFKKQISEMINDENRNMNEKLNEIETRFATNQQLREKLENAIIEQESAFVDQLKDMVEQNKEQFKRLALLSEKMTSDGYNDVREILKPLVGAAGAAFSAINNNSVVSPTIIDKKSSVIEADAVEVE